MSSIEESKAPEEKKPAARRSSLKTSDTGSKLDPQNLLKIKGKRHSVSFGQSNTFQFKAMKAMFQESNEVNNQKKKMMKSIKNLLNSEKKGVLMLEYQLEEKVVDKGFNVNEEDEI